MSKRRIGIAFLTIIFVILLLGQVFQRQLRLTVFVEPNTESEINWVANDGLWFGGTYQDEDGDGKLNIKLPADSTLVTLGRTFGPKLIISVFLPTEGQLLRENANSYCPIFIPDENIVLVNECTLSTTKIDEAVAIEDLELIGGESAQTTGLLVKDFSLFLDSPLSARLLSIELLEKESLDTLPTYSGMGQIVGYDFLDYAWGFR